MKKLSLCKAKRLAKMPISIDLTQAYSNYTKELFTFFNAQSQLGIKVWKKNTPYRFADGTQFALQHDVFQRERKEGHPGVRYEVMSNSLPLGKGHFGKIIIIEGTLVLDADSFRCKKRGENKTRVVKVQFHSVYENPLSQLQFEYELTKRANHLAVKKPTLATNSSFSIVSHTSYTVMKEIFGRQLLDILNDDIEGIHVLSLKQRFELSNALLHALNVQVTSNGIVHRDIKPENILVHLGPPILVNIVDFGLSLLAGKSDGKRAGTKCYSAPEIIVTPHLINVKADVFSMARVIALLWGVDLDTYGEDYLYNVSSIKMIGHIFSGIVELDKKTKGKIRSVLLDMLHIHPANRISIDEAIARFPSEKSRPQLHIATQSLPISISPPATVSVSKHSLFTSKSEGCKADQRLNCATACANP